MQGSLSAVRVALVLATVLAGCARGGEGVAVVSLSALPSLPEVARLEARVTAGAEERSLSIPVALRSIPPALTFAVVVPSRLASRVEVHVDAFDAAGARVGGGDGGAPIDAGLRSDVAVELRPPRGCGAGGRDCPAGSGCLEGRCVVCGRVARLGGTPPVSVGAAPAGLALGDLQQLPLPSILTASTSSPSARLLTNDLKGGFAPSDLAAILPISEVAIGKLNPTYRVSIARAADGSGLFLLFDRSSQTLLPCGRGAGLLFLDLDGDGFDEVVAGATGGLDVFDNKDGKLQPRRTVPVSPGEVTALAAGDVDGDGLVDLAVTVGGKVEVLRNDGGRAFSSISSVTGSQGTCRGVALGDFDRDGHLDVAFGDADGRRIGVQLGRGNGSFRAPVYRDGLPAAPAWLVAADLDGDQRTDVAAALERSHLAVLRSLPDGALAPPSLYPAGERPQRAAAGDLDGDGDVDVVVTDAASSTVGIFYQSGGALIGGQPRLIPAPFDSWGVQLLDFNRDGKLDIAYSDVSHVAVRTNGGDGRTFGEPVSTFLGGNTLIAVGFGDLDADGYPDFALPSLWTNELFVALNREGASIEPAGALAVTDGGADALIADFDGDGVPDVASLSQRRGNIHLFRNEGGGVVAPWPTLHVERFMGALAAADLDLDGDLDLVATAFAPGEVVVFLGAGDGTFGPPAFFGAGADPVALRVTDIDGDGKPDLVVPGSGSDDVSLLLGAGDGSFRGVGRWAVGDNPRSLGVADFDGDGRRDLLVANGSSRDLSLLRGDGRSGFLPAQRLELAGRSPYRLAVGDLDGDSRSDVVVTTEGGSAMAVLRNESGMHCVYLP